MAPSLKHFPFLLLLILFSSSLQIHARDSQFFSKVTNPNNNNNNVKEESQLPNKEELESKQLKEQEQEPTFVPDTQEGYGLYGHGSGQLPPSTTGNNIPYAEYSNNNNNNYYYNKNSYNAKQQGLKDTVLYDTGYTTMSNRNNYYNGDNVYSSSSSNNNNNNNNNNGYNTKQQGMSDTRFLENGRYYYDLNSEKNYRNEYENSRTEYSRNEYNNRGYYGNNNNNENSYEFDNSMEGYQNQEQYQESQDEFVPWSQDEFVPWSQGKKMMKSVSIIIRGVPYLVMV